MIVKVHSSVLFRNVEFFRLAMKPDWDSSRGIPDTIDLGDDEVKDVENCVHWLYPERIVRR
jgi:hypothetical protein